MQKSFGKSSIYDVLKSDKDGYFDVGKKCFKKTTGFIHFTQSKEANWNLLNRAETNWVNTINSNATHIVKDFFKVRVGIKTTADKVFIKKDWSIEALQPEAALLKTLISQENIEPWGISNTKKLKVLYPHVSIGYCSF